PAPRAVSRGRRGDRPRARLYHPRAPAPARALRSVAEAGEHECAGGHTTLCEWAPRRLCRRQSRGDLALVERPCGGTYQSPQNVETPDVWPSAPRSPQSPLRTCSRRGASPSCSLVCTDSGGCHNRAATRSILKGGSHGLARCIYPLEKDLYILEYFRHHQK